MSIQSKESNFLRRVKRLLNESEIQIYNVEYNYGDGSPGLAIGHVKVKANSEEEALEKAEKYASNRHYRDDSYYIEDSCKIVKSGHSNDPIVESSQKNEAESIYKPSLIYGAYKLEQQWLKGQDLIDGQAPEIMLFIINDPEEGIEDTKLINRKDVYTYQPEENEYYLDMVRDSGDVLTDYNLEPVQKLVDIWNKSKKWESIDQDLKSSLKTYLDQTEGKFEDIPDRNNVDWKNVSDNALSDYQRLGLQLFNKKKAHDSFAYSVVKSVLNNNLDGAIIDWIKVHMEETPEIAKALKEFDDALQEKDLTKSWKAYQNLWDVHRNATKRKYTKTSKTESINEGLAEPTGELAVFAKRKFSNVNGKPEKDFKPETDYRLSLEDAEKWINRDIGYDRPGIVYQIRDKEGNVIKEVKWVDVYNTPEEYDKAIKYLYKYGNMEQIAYVLRLANPDVSQEKIDKRIMDLKRAKDQEENIRNHMYFDGATWQTESINEEYKSGDKITIDGKQGIIDSTFIFEDGSILGAWVKLDKGIKYYTIDELNNKNNKNESVTYHFSVEDIGISGNNWVFPEEAYKEAKSRLGKLGYKVSDLTDDLEFTVIGDSTGVAYDGVIYSKEDANESVSEENLDEIYKVLDYYMTKLGFNLVEDRKPYFMNKKYIKADNTNYIHYIDFTPQMDNDQLKYEVRDEKGHQKLCSTYNILDAVDMDTSLQLIEFDMEGFE